MRIHPRATVFDEVADVYERARPSYPPEAVAFLVEQLDLRPGRTVLDLAAGTGKLTRLLVPSGARVIAVEPLAAMRAKLEEVVPAAEALAGAAEAIPLTDASVDAVTVAQAFHWFRFEEALAELHRVLRPGGGLALVWNLRDGSDELLQAIDELVESYREQAPSHAAGSWREPLETSFLFGRPQERVFSYVVETDAELLVERFLSVSFIAALPPARQVEVADGIRQLAGSANGPIAIAYETRVFVCYRAT